MPIAKPARKSKPAVRRTTRPEPIAESCESLLEILPHGILILDAKGRIAEINASASAMIGISKADALGRTARKAFPFWAEWESLLQAAKRPVPVICPTDPERSLELSRIRLPAGRGKSAGSLILLLDATDRIRMQEDHRRSMELLMEKTTEIQTLNASLRAQAVRDPVTSLFNRCYLQETLNRELARSARSKNPVSVIRIRLDRFAKADELYGEKAGVEILKIMTSLMNRYIRRGDLACRFDKDEFAVMMPGAPSSVAGPRAEQLRSAFHDSILNFLGAKIDCTFSCGVASFPNQGEMPDALLQSAGQALEKAVAAGGNQVVVCD
jgi:diguanylate cyclase (GGDEF)-like protein